MFFSDFNNFDNIRIILCLVTFVWILTLTIHPIKFNFQIPFSFCSQKKFKFQIEKKFCVDQRNFIFDDDSNFESIGRFEWIERSKKYSTLFDFDSFFLRRLFLRFDRRFSPSLPATAFRSTFFSVAYSCVSIDATGVFEFFSLLGWSKNPKDLRLKFSLRFSFLVWF